MNEFETTTLTPEQAQLRRAAAQAAFGRHAGQTLRLHVLASGSKGNCAIVENLRCGRCIVIDCGIGKKAFLERCEACGIDARSIDAILITHEHSDHTSGLGVVTRGLAKLGVQPTLYVSEKVHAASTQIRDIEDTLDLQHFRSGDDLVLAGTGVHAFPTLHDAAESFGFRFTCAKEAVGFMTDTGIVTGEAREALRGCNVLALEANHDVAMLEHGPYPGFLKARIASERGHLSNEQSASLLEELLCNELERVVGMHVSETNNTYDMPYDELTNVLQRNCHPAQALVGRQRATVSVR